MRRKKCFGSIKEVTLENGMTMTETKPECRDCAEFRDCLFHVKDADDERTQILIAKIIDHSEVHSNEVGTCLLDFLNRMCSHPMGSAFFKNLVLFYEVAEEDSSLTVTVPLSRSLLELIESGSSDREDAFDPSRIGNPEASEKRVTLRIILLQRRFPNDRKATTGLIAHEVAKMFSSNDHGTSQIVGMLSEPEARAFQKMDTRLRIQWLIDRWGFRQEHEAFLSEVAQLGTEKNRWAV